MTSSSSFTLEEEAQRKCIEDFFYDEQPDLLWIPLPVHTFEQRSPCKVIIISQMILGGSNPGYYCKLHLEIYSIHLDTVEHHHYKYNKQPEKRKSKILKILLNGGSSSKRWPLRQSVLDRVAGYKSQHSGVSITQCFYVIVIEQICLLSIWLRQTKYKRRCM
jgi:hypothetical protein